MTSLHRRGLLGLITGSLIAGSLIAWPIPARAVDLADVSAPIAALNAGLVQIMKAGRKVPFSQRFDLFAPIVDRAFDLTGILRVSVGQSWAKMTEQEHAELQKVFRQYTVASWVANFDEFNDDRFEILPELRAVGTDQVVATRLTAASGEVTKLDYVMRQTDTGWRAIDVLYNGTISNVVKQRSDFRGPLSEGGAAQLIASLKKKIADLSGGAIS